MAFYMDKYILRRSIEYEYKFVGKHGGKGERRANRSRPTPEEMRAVNQRNRETKYRRIIELNFDEHDLWCTVKYPRGDRPPLHEVIKDKDELLKKLRAVYKKNGETLKYIYRIEIGERGGIHFHILINRLWNRQTDIIIDDIWSEVLKKSYERRKGIPLDRAAGMVDYESVYREGGFRGLAKYITKQPEEDSEAKKLLDAMPEEDRRKLTKVSCSRNLKKPERIRKEYRARTMERMIKEGPKPSDPSLYYIDKDSIEYGVNPFTGFTYFRYAEILLKPAKILKKEGKRYGPD